MKVLSIVGNRPQFIKSAPLSVAFRSAGIEEILVHTGQHYDRELSDFFFDDLAMREPDHRLGVGSMPREEMIERMRRLVRAKIAGERPDWVLVFGDTNSTLAGALAASDEGVRIAHVESGMRSGDLSMPEEKNRIETDSLATLLFCPDERSRATLEAEGVSGETEVVGDVMADTALSFAPFARRQSAALERFGVELGAYLLVTVHREANVFQPRLGRIVEGINALSEPVVFPAHPRTRAALEREGLALGRHVVLSQPLGYIDFTALASQARVIVTDSGGLQKEAYWYGVPCVTLRPSTEWVDTIELGANVLVDDDPQLLVKAVTDASMPAERPVLYGDGNTAKRIADAISARA